MSKTQLEENLPWYFRQTWVRISRVIGWPLGKIFLKWKSLTLKHEKLRRYHEKFWSWNAENFISAAWERIEGKEYTTAVFLANFILQFLPDHPGALLILGVALAHLGEDDKLKKIFKRLMDIEAYPEAEELAREFVAVFPEDARYYNWLGRTLRKQKKIEEAIESYRKSVSLNPTLPFVFCNLGLALLEKGSPEEARVAFVRAAIYNPRDKDYMDGFIHSYPDINKLPSPAFEFAFPRVYAAKYLTIKSGKSTESIEEVEKIIQKMVRKKENASQRAYIGHVITTGHWSAESRLLRYFKKYIEGPVLNVGCGTGEQSLLAALFLDELSIPSTESESKNKSRKPLTLVYTGKKGERILMSVSLPPLNGRKGTGVGLGLDLKERRVSEINLFPRFPGGTVELSDHYFTVVSVDIDAKMLTYAAAVMAELTKNQQRLEFIFVPSDITKTGFQSDFNTALACYLFHWLGSRLTTAAIQNIASSLQQGGHLIVLGEYPLVYTPSPFLEYASSIQGEPKPIPMDEIIEICGKEGLEFVESKEVEIQTLELKDRHPMFGAVFRKK